MPPTVRRRDFLLIGAVVIIALLLALLVPKDDGNRVIVRTNGEPTHSLPLDRDTAVTLQNKGVTLTLVIKNGSAQVTRSNCPDGVCQATAPIKAEGQTIVCLPAAISVTVEGDPPVDGVTY